MKKFHQWVVSDALLTHFVLFRVTSQEKAWVYLRPHTATQEAAPQVIKGQPRQTACTLTNQIYTHACFQAEWTSIPIRTASCRVEFTLPQGKKAQFVVRMKKKSQLHPASGKTGDFHGTLLGKLCKEHWKIQILTELPVVCMRSPQLLPPPTG